MLKVRFLKALDRYVGTIAARVVPKTRSGKIIRPRRVLFIRPGGIGDAVLLIPAIRALKEWFPDCAIDVLAEKRNAAVFTLCDDIDRTLRYDSQGGFVSAIRGRYDVVIDSEQWHRLSALLARMTGAPVVIGFDTNVRRRLFTHSVPYSHDVYEADSFFSLLVPIGIPGPAALQPPFLSTGKAAAKATATLAELNLSPFVALFPGASIPERRWGTTNFRHLALRLGAEGIPVVVVGASCDRETGDAIVAGGNGLNLAGKTSLMETAEVLRRSLLLVTGDSGILHLAVGLGVPTVSLFGPGIARKWAPTGERHIVLNRHLPCSPCTRFGYTSRCRDGAPCIAKIGVDDVERAVLTLLAGKRS